MRQRRLPAPSAGGGRALRASRPPGLPPRRRSRPGPRPASRGCGADRSPAGRTLTGAGTVRSDQRSGAEVVSAPGREASELRCERYAPAAEPPLRRARPPFPAPLANAGRTRSRQPARTICCEAPPPALCRGLPPKRSRGGGSLQGARSPHKALAQGSLCASRGLRPCPASFPPIRIAPSKAAPSPSELGSCHGRLRVPWTAAPGVPGTAATWTGVPGSKRCVWDLSSSSVQAIKSRPGKIFALPT